MAAKKLRPFHETIVKVLKQASGSDLRLIATLLLETRIPKKYRENVLAAWQERSVGMCSPDYNVTEHFSKLP